LSSEEARAGRRRQAGKNAKKKKERWNEQGCG
jgi:hypothetical protein